ncbi:MAG: PEP-CTERM system histidine kinase PrsK [Desulfobulbaceae bacterium]|nr:PEP-CTERM system histidine kinase PrsK [Desulfobulbaceae bacterium]
MITFFYTLDILLLLAGLLSIYSTSGEKRFSLALIQSLIALPLLASQYLYLAYNFTRDPAQLLLFSEVIFGYLWLLMTLHLHRATTETGYNSILHGLVEGIIAAAVSFAAYYYLAIRGPFSFSEEKLFFSQYNPVYISSLAILTAILYSSWRLEQFWRSLGSSRRWEYKFFIVGSLLICGAIAWSTSYRLTYQLILPKHLLLLSALLCLGWAMITYAVVHHRLLNRKIFVSRKILYSAVVPSLLAAYFLSFGIVSLIMRIFGFEMFYVLQWMILVLGIIVAALFVCSGKIRRRVQFFISTHFYINKYEYRDEWLALSQQLQGALSEAEIVKGLREVLTASLYTTQIYIWLGDSDLSQDLKLTSSPEFPTTGASEKSLGANDILIRYFMTHSFLHTQEKEPDPTWEEVIREKASLLQSLNLTLLTPISLGNQLVGIIGLGPEFTGGRYGHDDFDLLTALGCQSASALLAVRMAEELAYAREQQAWQRLSAFVLHDIKDAATMLALLQENAPEHIHEPKFQQDMLELVDDALRRMGRVEKRLGTFKNEVSPKCKKIRLYNFLQEFCTKFENKLPSMEILIEGSNSLEINSDPEFLNSILENVLLNAHEAKGEGTVVRITFDVEVVTSQVLLNISDNGPGIPVELLPDVLFEPFKTSKAGGSGIGLWQLRREVTGLGGTVAAANNENGGATIIVRLPQEGADKSYIIS